MIAILLLSLHTMVSVMAAQSSPPVIYDVFLSGSVELFATADFNGFSTKIEIHAANACYNSNCYDQKTGSATWELSPDGVFNSDAYIAFYEDQDCQGMMHMFNLRDRKNVTDLDELSNLDGEVSSLMVLKIGATPLSYVKKCKTQRNIPTFLIKPSR